MTAYSYDPPAPRPQQVPKPELDLKAAEAHAKSAFEKGEALRDAGDQAGAVTWLTYARSCAPADQTLRFTLAAALLQAGLLDEAALHFAAMTEKFQVRECATGLASASLRAGRLAEARAAVQAGLAENTTDAALAGLADQLAASGGATVWCGVRQDGVLLTNVPPSRLTIMMDGTRLRLRPAKSAGPPPRFASKLPPEWRTGRMLSVQDGQNHVLGSPVQLHRLTRLEGFCERTKTGIAGWAWYPSAPEIDPVITLTTASAAGRTQRRSLTASALSVAIDGAMPLARPRGFAARVAPDATVSVRAEDGTHLLGSPLLPLRKNWRQLLTPRGKPGRGPEPDLPVDVIIPVYRGLEATRACLNSVIGTVPAPGRIIVVNDASPEPAVTQLLEQRAAAGSIALIPSHPDGGNHGFPAAVNAGLRAVQSHHVVLLNSDTLVPPGWLERLRAAANSAPDIGTATPISNEASIFSYPKRDGGNPAPDLAGTIALDALAASANGNFLAEVPTANGFCMFIRRDCLAATGRFEDELFAQGYGEENDFTERARAQGFKHVAVPGVFVAHHGGVSFGRARIDLLRRNVALLAARHPAYLPRVQQAASADPLFHARRRLETAIFETAADGRPAVILVSHAGGGGTARIIAERAEQLEAAGKRAIVLRPTDGFCTIGDGKEASANLRFVLPAENSSLLELLRAAQPTEAEIHHLKGHREAVLEVITALAVPYDVWVHDYGWFCARLSFITARGQFCGEADTATCAICIKSGDRPDEGSLAPAALRARSAALFRTAREVIVPSRDVSNRVRRHVPGSMPRIEAWEPLPRRAPPSVRLNDGPVTVAVIGAIGIEKGYDILLACAQDAAARELNLCFVVVGYTSGDATLLATGTVRITGEFTRAEAASLIRAQGAHVAFLPSIWPETWCYALSDAWQAGLSAAVFDIGTTAMRVRACGRGWILPLALQPSAINDMFIKLGDSQNVPF